MKKLLSILLAVAMIMAFAMPAFAEESSPADVNVDVAITSNIQADELCGKKRIDSVEGEGIVEDKEWIYYDLSSTATFDATVAGTAYKGISVKELRALVAQHYSFESILIGASIECDQSATNHFCLSMSCWCNYGGTRHSHNFIQVCFSHCQSPISIMRLQRS